MTRASTPRWTQPLHQRREFIAPLPSLVHAHHVDHHPHHSAEHHAPDVDLGTLPVPGAQHDDHAASAHDANAVNVEVNVDTTDEPHDPHGHEEPSEPEEDLSASPPNDDLGHDDPGASHHESEPEPETPSAPEYQPKTMIDEPEPEDDPASAD